MTLTIRRLGHHGDGIADGPVYVPLTLPGEEVDGELDGNRLPRPRILTPSPDRVTPPCRHFPACGGCALQHASDGFVETWKADQVRTALAAQGLDAPIRHISTSPPRSRRRATFSARRTKKGALAGFHARALDTIQQIPDCQLVMPDLSTWLPALEDLARIGASRRGELSVTVTQSRRGPDVDVTGGRDLDGPLRIDLSGWAQTHAAARLTWTGEPIVELAPAVQDFDGIETVPPPGAFLQATRHGETALRRSVAEAVQGAACIVDLFAGCGTFALPLTRGAAVHAVEGDAALLQAADRGWRGTPGLKALTTESRDLFRRPLLPSELDAYDAAVIDPPRAGAETQTRQLAAAGLLHIAAVSCNPQTFARDAAILVAAGYALRWIDVVDQFRWSTHVELAAAFTRADM